MRLLSLGLAAWCCCCSAAMPPSSPVFYTVLPTAPRPRDVPMNRDAGLGGWVILNIRLAQGKSFPVVVDTGCPTTCLDRSFEPELGQCVSTNAVWDFGVKSRINLYAAPALFLNGTRLMKAGPYIVTHDCKQISNDVGRPILGILGMDILQNYCIQLDFSDRKIRFPDYDHSSKRNWGKPLALWQVGDGCMSISGNLAGTNGPGSLIDTGYNQDGWLVPSVFEEWTNQDAPAAVHRPDGNLDGEIYPALNLRGVDPKLLSTGDAHIKLNGIGLHFLARHLVTLDFPEQTLYLKRVTIGPPVDKALEAETKSEEKSAAKFLKDLEHHGRLPGWSRADRVAANRITFQDSDSRDITFDIPKAGSPLIYHYALSRDSNGDTWKLKKAWSTDESGRVIEEYPIR